MQQFDAWLIDRGWNTERRERFLGYLQIGLMDRFSANPPMDVLLSIPGIELPSPQEGSEQFQYDAESIEEQHYLMSIATTLLGTDLSANYDLGLSHKEVVLLYIEFRRDAALTSEQLSDKAEALVTQIEQLNLIGESGFFITNIDGSILSICTTEFNEETYKRTENCREIDLESLGKK